MSGLVFRFESGLGEIGRGYKQPCVFKRYVRWLRASLRRPRSTTMTVQGTAVKTFVLLAILAATAAWSWNQLASGEIAFGVVAISGIGGFITAMITIFKPTAAPVDRADLRGF